MADMPLPTIDENGIHVPDYAALWEWLRQSFRDIYGGDIYIEADSQDGQLIGIFALALSTTYSFATAVYNSFSPATAQGVGLSRVIKINGMTRISAAYSTVDLLLTGAVGTIISGGRVRAAGGAYWRLPETVVIPAGGTVTVTAEAEEIGPLVAEADTLTEIATPTVGWTAVTNPQPAVPGRATENDAELRRRQKLSTALPSRTVLEGIIGAVAALEGVSRYAAVENDSDATDGNGITAHTIALVVEGGDAAAIADAIFTKKTPGTRTMGTTTQTVVDAYGLTHTVSFYRPTPVPVKVEVSLRALANYSTGVGDAIKQAVVAAINAMAIGEDVFYTRLYAPALLCGPYAAPLSPTDPGTYELLGVEIAKLPDPFAAADIVIAFTEVPSAAVADVTLVIT